MAGEKYTVIWDIQSAGTLATVPAWKETEFVVEGKEENASYGGPVCESAGIFNPATAKVATVIAASAAEAAKAVRAKYGMSSNTNAKFLTAKTSNVSETAAQ